MREATDSFLEELIKISESATTPMQILFGMGTSKKALPEKNKSAIRLYRKKHYYDVDKTDAGKKGELSRFDLDNADRSPESWNVNSHL